MVLDIDEGRRRISLGIKHCYPNPWDEFATTHNKNDKVVGHIKSITDFGIFIGLDGGIDGLVHLSDISWNAPGEVAVRNYKKGDEVEAVVLAVDAERERISLGIKQLDKDPFSNFVTKYPKGSFVKGVVSEVDNNKAIVQLEDGVEGLLRAQELAHDRVDDVRHFLKAGEEVEAKFIGVDRKKRIVNLSIKALTSEIVDVEEYSDSLAAGTFGDIFPKEEVETEEVKTPE
jgi:small subunit ribosomal protein S1